MFRNRRSLVVWLAGLTIGLLVVAVWLWWARPLLPHSITKQINYAIFVPRADSAYVLDRGRVAYDGQNKILTLLVRNGSRELTLTEQATPTFFVSAPDFLKLKFDTLKNHQSIATVYDTAYVGQDDQSSGLVSSMSAKGTLIFVRTSSGMSTDDWRAFYRSLMVLN